MAAVRLLGTLLAVAPALSAYLLPSARRSRLDHTRMRAVDGESMAPLPAGVEKQVLRSGEAFYDEAEKMAALILKPKRTHDETASLVPFVADQCYSIHKIDTRVCNQEVRRDAKKRTLLAGAVGWGLVGWGQMHCVNRLGAVLVRWWILVIIMSLLKWAFYVFTKIALLADARNLYQKKKAKA